MTIRFIYCYNTKEAILTLTNKWFTANKLTTFWQNKHHNICNQYTCGYGTHIKNQDLPSFFALSKIHIINWKHTSHNFNNSYHIILGRNSPNSHKIVLLQEKMFRNMASSHWSELCTSLFKIFCIIILASKHAFALITFIDDTYDIFQSNSEFYL